MGDRLRAVDLARAAGISTQQVRNYVETGLLPPVERTDSGYRVFTDVHADALTAARALAAGHGWPTAGAVMRAVHGDDLETALAVLDASHAELHRERGELAEVLGVLDTLVTLDTPAADRGGLRIGEVADAIGVRTPVLRLWEARGLLRPTRERSTGYRTYSASEARLARIVALLRRGEHPFSAIAPVLAALRTGGSPERVRAELAGRERELLRRSLTRLRGSAALDAYLERLGKTVR
ncbi:MerR family transcriptional regulator [Streptomyces sp. BH-SS-21]|uniref:MerR family transcriptional regulator n=1 Tax=Streptomyces liliiviolaceus TaxID=2823109 RepID=A0A941BFH8_9ACTN|nr:MerR family transcriptional regulator [Streptomyces liliiviolaceus]MBQ0851684.1 MerR family transcriptional regulator [Streptomyces liliiviolaceus]